MSVNKFEELKQYVQYGVYDNIYCCYHYDTDLIFDSIKKLSIDKVVELLEISSNQSFNYLILVYLSIKDKKRFNEYFNYVIKNPIDLLNFIEQCKEVRGLGRLIKTMVNNWISDNVTADCAIFYRKELADTIRLTHYKGSDSIFYYISQIYKKSSSLVKLNQVYDDYPIIYFYTLLENAIERKDIAEVNNIVAEGHFNTQMKCRHIKMLNHENIYELMSKVNGSTLVGFLLLFDDDEKIIDKLIQDIDLKFYEKYIGDNFSLSMIISQLKNERSIAHLSQFYSKDNDKKIAIIYDTSKNMKLKINKGDISTEDVIQSFLKVENTVPIKWDGESINSMIYLENNPIEFDFCIFITDNKEFVGKWFKLWKSYKNNHKNTKCILINNVNCIKNRIDSQISKDYDIYQVFGFDHNAYRYIKKLMEIKNV